jgi:hypothetical protein
VISLARPGEDQDAGAFTVASLDHRWAMGAAEGESAQTRRHAVKLRLLPPEIVPITKEQHEQAVSALAAMIVDWLHRRDTSDETTTVET